MSPPPRSTLFPYTTLFRSVLVREPDYNDGKFKLIDSEIAALYETKTDQYERDYRRVLGLNWRTVIGNTSIDRKSTRLNSSHVRISYAVFCLKKKKNTKYNC